MSNIYQLDQWGYLGKSYSVAFSHGTTSDTNDLEILRRINQFISITPESEHHYNLGQISAHTFLSQSALGIDSSYTYSFSSLVPVMVVLLCTALIGVIKKGAKADVVVFNTDNAATSAFYDPIAAVVLHSNVGNIEHVLVDVIWLEYDKDWASIRKDDFETFGGSEDDYMAILAVDVESSVLKKH
ncbi:MAG: hypothetical protein J3R72DRAFT_500202 [Linnemannia gamsii]|nr:MAG: hypothetical protein J3R72DRAFT_500202 [Linnemannia gamsii]